MTRDQIIDRLRDVMRDSSPVQADWNTVHGDTTIESLGFDSLTILDLLYDIQQAFSIELEAEKLAGVRTVGQLADHLQPHVH